MYLNFICGSKVRVRLEADGEPFWNQAQAGLLNETMSKLVDAEKTKFCAASQSNADLFQEFKSIRGILYSGALERTDSLPSKMYMDQSIAIVCDWAMSPTTAQYSLELAGQEAGESLTSLYRFEETKLPPEFDKPLWPVSVDLYKTCIELIASSQKNLEALSQDGAIQLLDARLKTLAEKKQTKGAYYGALEFARDSMENMKSITTVLLS